MEGLQVEIAIVRCLNWIGVPDEAAAALALMVQKAGKEDEMLDWLEANEGATAQEVIQAVVQITQ